MEFSSDSFTPPVGYPNGLALCIIDAVWSIGVKYGGVVTVLNRYREWVPGGANAEVRTSAELAEDIKDVGGPDGFADLVVKNRQRTSSTNGIPKAEAVQRCAAILRDLRILTPAELQKPESNAREQAKALWKQVPGQRSGISWHYLLMLAQVEDIKADRMILGFVADSVNDGAMTPDRAYEAMIGAHTLLKREFPEITLRGLDHAVWSFQRTQ